MTSDIYLLKIARAASPFPTIGSDGDLQDGLSIKQSATCQACKKPECATIPPRLDDRKPKPVRHMLCWRGLSVVFMQWPFANMVSNGLIVRSKNQLPNVSLRRTNKSQRVYWNDLVRFHQAFGSINPHIENIVDSRVNKAIDSLHDVRTAVSLVTRNAEAIAMSLPGHSDDERIESAPPDLKSLLKSVRLLQTRLALSSLLSNPIAASYGNKRATPVYKVFDRMVRLFTEQAARSRVSITMTGSSYAQPMCYDSFETIALVLIDNAIKYSLEGTTVFVHVQDTSTGPSVWVRSYGPSVLPDEEGKIFDRGFRSPAAQSFASTGSGIGLYLAKIVAEAHNFAIGHTCSFTQNEPAFGTNTFSFVFPDA